MSTSTTSKNKHALMPQQRLHFYQNGHMATEVANQVNRHVLWANDVTLAQLDKSQPAKMLRVDLANSVLGLASESMAYSPYGYLATEKMKALLQFNGQWCDPFTEGYHLGQGHRVYSPRRMRFCSDDESSPMGEGGVHPSAYCEGDPINRYDPTGQFFQFLKRAPINRVASRMVTNLGRTMNFLTSGTSRYPTRIDPTLRKIYSVANSTTERANGSLNTIPLPEQSLRSSSRPAPLSKVTATEANTQILNPAPFPNAQKQPSTLIGRINNVQVSNSIEYGSRNNSNFAAKVMVGSVLFIGGGLAAIIFGMKAIRKD